MAHQPRKTMIWNKMLSFRTWSHLLVVLTFVVVFIYAYLYKVSVVSVKHEQESVTEWTYREMNVSTIDIVNLSKKYPNYPLLTLFTTWAPNDSKPEVRKLTLRNWSHFKPFIKPVFFRSKNETNTSFYEHYNWDILLINKTAAFGVPVLKYMFMEVISRYKSLFYGYVNGDILFDDGLIQTLQVVSNTNWTGDKPFLIVGRRTNVINVTEAESGNIENLALIAKNKGQLFRQDAEDYFITDSSFPWADIPELVIGRRGYDNWLVLHSCKHRYHVIDATKTTLALHQTTKSGNFEGHTHPQGSYNVKLLHKLYKKISYRAGSTVCAPWFSHKDGIDDVLLYWATPWLDL